MSNIASDRASCYLMVVRQQALPKLWIWQIRQAGDRLLAVAPAGFRSADEAWDAGHAQAARLRLRLEPRP